jgi:aminoglycoside/choline kinase family phosphotransferase
MGFIIFAAKCLNPERFRYNADRMATTNPTAPPRPLAVPDPLRIAQAVRTRLPFTAELASLTPLAGDASNRRYFRINLKGARPGSAILMQLAEPEGFKQSEEAVSGASIQIDELPFVNILSHLAKAGVSVPSLYWYDREGGFLYLEDLGDVTLAEACRDAGRTHMEELYRQAIDGLILLQTNGTARRNPACIAFHRSFDVPLLMWDFEHFLEYGVAARQEKPMKPEDESAIRESFQRIAHMLADEPRVFVHRDYHSRNLMVDGGRLGMIDFQDALLGPASYDLASLLRDAYIQLDEDMIQGLIERFLDGMAAQGRAWADRAAFRRLFDLTSIQRNLKAAGRFVYIDRVKQNPKFLADIPRVLGYVKRNLLKYPELASLRKHLTPYVPELQ